ncbi:lysostaphin resistance A-like protein [Aestuariibius insulae]|uniref:CPBP family intramembrane glutamic endopeptidase n=1 Tax=Aestuariibius insulae TaxID=2058287 RepID=UPI00345ED7F3
MVFAVYGSALLQDDEIALTPADWRAIAIASIAALVVGLFEELLFRGALLHGLRSKVPAVAAVLLAAVIFGLFHLVNWIGGQPLDITVAQVIGAAGGGVFYGALVLWTGSLWPSIFMHGLWDAAVTLDQTILDAEGSTADPAQSAPALDPWSALLSPELIYGLLLLGLWGWRQRHRSKT